MDPTTLDYYDRCAAEAAAKYRAVDQSAWRQQIQEAFSKGGRVLDVGAGSGCDLALLREMGFDAYGAEPVEAIRWRLFGLSMLGLFLMRRCGRESKIAVVAIAACRGLPAPPF